MDLHFIHGTGHDQIPGLDTTQEQAFLIGRQSTIGVLGSLTNATGVGLTDQE